VSGICLYLAGGALATALAGESFTLAWTHSVEKVEWQEDWRLENGALALAAARVKGSGAGMEPPAGAVLAGGWWNYRPVVEPLSELRLARSGAVADYRLCRDGTCLPLGQIAEGAGAAEDVVVRACP
jgi:hypothetical protein